MKGRHRHRIPGQAPVDKQASMSGDEAAAGSPQLSLSGLSSLFSISSTTHTAPARPRHHLDVPLPSLCLGVGTGGEDEDVEEEDQVVSSGRGTAASIRMMRNRESALRSRARKRAYVQELEKEVRRLADDNLRLKRQCKQLKTEVAALIQQQPTSPKLGFQQ